MAKLHLADLGSQGQTMCGLSLATARVGVYHGERDERGHWAVRILPTEGKPSADSCRGCLLRYQRALWLEAIRETA